MICIPIANFPTYLFLSEMQFSCPVLFVAFPSIHLIHLPILDQWADSVKCQCYIMMAGQNSNQGGVIYLHKSEGGQTEKKTWENKVKVTFDGILKTTSDWGWFINTSLHLFPLVSDQRIHCTTALSLDVRQMTRHLIMIIELSEVIAWYMWLSFLVH